VAVAGAGQQDEYRVPAVKRAFAIIRVLAEHGRMPLADIVEASRVNKSTAFYILRTLADLDVVGYDETTRTYALGPALMELGLLASDQVSAIAIAKRELTELLETMDATIALYRRVNVGEIVLVDKLERAHRVRITVQAGMRLPIQGGSFGRAFLAFDDQLILDQALADGMHAFTPKSLTDVAAFRRQLEAVRRQGWAVDHEGFALGVSTVAAPIFGPGGRIALVAAAVGFTSVFTEEAVGRIGEQLRAACDRISTILGGDGRPFAAGG
jgi:DNA-binding IclR family transcriptional regulator